MIRLALPNITFSTLFDECAARVPAAIRPGLQAELPLLENRAAEYADLGEASKLHEMTDRDPVHTNQGVLESLYDPHLLSACLRSRYAALKTSPKNQCPYCSFREVKTLDHYLPKSIYADFSVHPANLVPCCRDCNSSKLARLSLLQENLAFHPYFDDWGNYELLIAKMSYSPYAEVFFGTSTSPAIPQMVRQRAGAHFDLFELSSLFSMHGNAELIDRRAFFVEAFDSGGASGLKRELERELHSRRAANLNSWQSAMYRCLVADTAFLNGGCHAIPDPTTGMLN